MNRSLVVIFSLIGFVLVVAIIYNTTKTNKAIENIQITPTVAQVNQKMQDSELKTEDIRQGQGEAVKEGDTVEVNYTGTLTNGTKFDSSYDRNQTFKFTVGVGQVIQGWDKGLIGMKKGGLRKLTIPSSLAYGEQGVPGAIPPNSPLIFEIELVSIN